MVKLDMKTLQSPFSKFDRWKQTTDATNKNQKKSRKKADRNVGSTESPLTKPKKEKLRSLVQSKVEEVVDQLCSLYDSCGLSHILQNAPTIHECAERDDATELYVCTFPDCRRGYQTVKGAIKHYQEKHPWWRVCGACQGVCENNKKPCKLCEWQASTHDQDQTTLYFNALTLEFLLDQTTMDLLKCGDGKRLLLAMKVEVTLLRASVDRLEKLRKNASFTHLSGVTANTGCSAGETEGSDDDDDSDVTKGRPNMSVEDIMAIRKSLRKNGPVQYVKGTIDQIVDILTSPIALQLDLLYGNFYSARGGEGGNVPIDQLCEQIVRKVKLALKDQSLECKANYERVVAFIHYGSAMCDSFDRDVGISPAGVRRNRPDDTRSVEKLLDYFAKHEVWSPSARKLGWLPHFLADPWMEMNLPKLVKDSMGYLWDKQHKQNALNNKEYNVRQIDPSPPRLEPGFDLSSLKSIPLNITKPGAVSAPPGARKKKRGHERLSDPPGSLCLLGVSYFPFYNLFFHIFTLAMP